MDTVLISSLLVCQPTRVSSRALRRYALGPTRPGRTCRLAARPTPPAKPLPSLAGARLEEETPQLVGAAGPDDLEAREEADGDQMVAGRLELQAVVVERPEDLPARCLYGCGL